MEAVNSFKGYDKVEEASSQRKSRKRVIIISVSVILLVVLLIGILAGTLSSRNGNLHSAEVNSVAAAVRSICGVTRYKDSCIASLMSSNSSDPERIFQYSLNVVMNSFQNLTSFPGDYRSRHGGESGSIMRQALDVCETVLEHSIDTLNDTISAMNVRKGQSILSAQRVEDLKTWLSTVITDQQTCLDALQEVNATFVDEIKQLTKNANEFASNSLAIVSRLFGLLSDFKIPIHRKLLDLDSTGSFPKWVSPADRRLLQTNQPRPNVVVAKDGTGDVTTIGAAVQMIPPKNTSRFIIYVKAGDYVENLVLSKHLWNVMIYGDGSKVTTISGSLNFVDGTPTFQTATVAVTGPSFMARDIGFRNTAGAAKHQAVAFRSASDQSVYYRCLFDGFQDTLYTYANRQFYRECTITGTIDFIFGNAAVVFQSCNILPRQPMSNQFNTITAQGKTDPNQNTGTSIQRCVVSALDALTAPTYLGRPWKNYSTTVFMQTNIGGFLNPQGWTPWLSGVVPPSTIFYGEYQNTGPGAGTANRVNWTGVYNRLTPAQASQFTVGTFIQGTTWLPSTGVAFEST